MSRPIALVQSRVAAAHHVPVAAMRSPRRRPDWVEARHVAMYLAYATVPNASLPMIARAFGKFDHTTALHAVRKIERRMAQDPAYAARIRNLQEDCERDLACLQAQRLGSAPRNDVAAEAQALAVEMTARLNAEAARDPEAFIRRHGQ